MVSDRCFGSNKLCSDCPFILILNDFITKPTLSMRLEESGKAAKRQSNSVHKGRQLRIDFSLHVLPYKLPHERLSISKILSGKNQN